MKEKKQKAFGPILASVILPGLGQIFMGFKALGRSMMGGALGFFTFGFYSFIRGYIAYMDLVLDFEPNAPTPDVWQTMHLTTVIVCFACAIVIHGVSIIHAVYHNEKQKDRNNK